jgi:hypothetical protein
MSLSFDSSTVQGTMDDLAERTRSCEKPSAGDQARLGTAAGSSSGAVPRRQSRSVRVSVDPAEDLPHQPTIA